MDGKYTVRPDKMHRRHRLTVQDGLEYRAIVSGLRDNMIEPKPRPEWREAFQRRDLTEIFPETLRR